MPNLPNIPQSPWGLTPYDPSAFGSLASPNVGLGWQSPYALGAPGALPPTRPYTLPLNTLLAPYGTGATPALPPPSATPGVTPSLGSTLGRYTVNSPVLPQRNIGMTSLGGLGVSNPTGLASDIPAWQARASVPRGNPSALPPGVRAGTEGLGRLYDTGTTPPPRPGSAGTGAGASAGAGGTPTPNSYSAFRGMFAGVRDPLSASGSIGSRLPGALTTPIPFGPQAGGAIGSRLPGFLTADTATLGRGGGALARFGGSAARAGAGLGTAMALTAVPEFLINATDAEGTYGASTARSVGRLSALGLLGGAPIAATVGAGVGLGDAVASNDWVRDNIINGIRGAIGWAPTDSTLGESLANLPGIGGLLSGEGGGGDAAPADQAAPMPATPESLQTIGALAGLDPTSTSLLQRQFESSLAVSLAQYQWDPEGFKANFEQVNGVPIESEDDIARVIFSRIVSESLPVAVEQQSARAAMLQNAAQYQDFISQYYAPIRDQYSDIASRASAAGFGGVAERANILGASTESQLRSMPAIATLQAQQAQIDQLSQQQMAQALSGGGGQSPFGDGATLEALLAGAG